MPLPLAEPLTDAERAALEAEGRRQVPVLEDPDERAEARQDGEHVHEDRLDRQQDGSQ